MKKYDYIIGIDPDVEKSGVAVLDVKERIVETAALDFPHLLEKITDFAQDREMRGETFCVCVEAGWKNAPNWHLSYKHDNLRTAAKKGWAVGRNHQIGMTIVEVLKAAEMDCIEVRPLIKDWRGTDGKITAEELMQFMPIRNKKRTNQEERDAALIAWTQAGFPIRMHYTTK